MEVHYFIEIHGWAKTYRYNEPNGLSPPNSTCPRMREEAEPKQWLLTAKNADCLIPSSSCRLRKKNVKMKLHNRNICMNVLSATYLNQNKLHTKRMITPCSMF